MKTYLVGVLLLTLAVAAGCTESSSDKPKAAASRENGQEKDGVKVVAKKPVAGEADKTFSLSIPFESVALTQGEEKSILIGINRGENFREEVTIEVTDLPQGVTLETSKPVIQQGDTDATLMLKAAPDASVGDFTFMVKGLTTSSGADFSKEVNLTVTQK